MDSHLHFRQFVEQCAQVLSADDLIQAGRKASPCSLISEFQINHSSFCFLFVCTGADAVTLFMSFLGEAVKAMPPSANWWNTRIYMQYHMKTTSPPWKKIKNQRECHSKGLIIAPERWREMCSPLRLSSDLQRGVIHLLFWVRSNPRLHKRNLGNCFKEDIYLRRFWNLKNPEEFEIR